MLLIAPLEGAACAATAALLLAAGHARLPWLATPILLRIGTLSYCLYLVHQNIGYVIERELRTAGFPESLSIIRAVACALACAAVLYAVVEKPAMAAFSRPRESVSL